jgi:hypothetical protein
MVGIDNILQTPAVKSQDQISVPARTELGQASAVMNEDQLVAQFT